MHRSRSRGTTCRWSHPTGFSLVELLVVVGVVAVLIAILLPALGRARSAANDARCLSNLGQLARAAGLYANDHAGRLPLAYDLGPAGVTVHWDYIVVDGVASPGVLWRDYEQGDVQQCPSFDGRANAADNPHTGYNYNADYLGGHRTPFAAADSARLAQLAKPAETAMFGDGQYADGANKFMRGPVAPPPGHPGSSFGEQFRHAGTQGYRHAGRTNLAHPDGHAAATADRSIGPDAFATRVADDTGYLADDNAPYDLQ